MQENSQSQPSSISQSTTLEEMAEFWDTHDTADYWDQFEEIQISVTWQGFPDHELNRVERLVRENREELLEAWYDTFA